MTTTATKPTLKDLRAEAQRLGLTAESAGCPIEELLKTARDADDPLGYLTIYAPAPIESKPPKPETPPAEEEPEIAEDVGAVPVLEPMMATITVPLSPSALEGCYISNHVDVRMTIAQATVLRRLHLALDTSEARLANDRHIASTADAVRWLLEEIGRTNSLSAS